MSTQATAGLESTHPAPHRARAGLWALVFGAAAAPLAWNLQLLVSVAMVSHACFPGREPVTMPIWSAVWSIVLGVTLAGLVLGVAAGLLSVRNWRRTRSETRGHGRRLLSSGEGRTRFLAMCGILTSVLFIVALAFATLSLFLSPLCGA